MATDHVIEGVSVTDWLEVVEELAAAGYDTHSQVDRNGFIVAFIIEADNQ